MTNQTSREESGPRIRRARYDSLLLYEITEDELDSLEKGSIESIYLNFAIFTLSIAITLLITLQTATIVNNRIFITYVIITIIGFLAGIILGVLWIRERKSSQSVCAKIRARKIEEGEHSDLADEVDDPHSTIGDTSKTTE